MAVQTLSTGLLVLVICQLIPSSKAALLNCAGFPLACTELQHQQCEDTDTDGLPDTCLCVYPYYLRINSCHALPSAGQEAMNPCRSEDNDPACLNGGSCHYNHTLHYMSCRCPPTHTGLRCETELEQGCPMGHYLDEGVMRCTPCRKGTYKPLTGTNFCDSCPEGQVTQGEGSIECIQGPSVQAFTAPYGPLAGGTIVNITVQEAAGFLVSNASSVTVAGIKCDSTRILLNKTSNATKVLQCKTSPAPSKRTGPIILTIHDFNFTSTVDFEYRDNPEISNVNNTKTFFRGGKIIKIFGDHLNSVFTPKIVITVTSKHTKSAKSNCRVLTPDMMECPTPNLRLLSDAIGIQQVVQAPSPTTLTPSSTSNIRTSTQSSTSRVAETPPTTAAGEESSTMTTFVPAVPPGEEAASSGRRKRQAEGTKYGRLNNEFLHFWLGFELDGFNKYKNVSEIDVYGDPKPHAFHTDINRIYYYDYEFYRGTIDIKGQRLDGGADKEDYIVTVGLEPCNVTALVTNAIHCALPPVLPPPKPNRKGGPDNIPMMHVKVGDLNYDIGYIDYMKPGPKTEILLAIIIGIVLAIIVIVVAIIICRRRRRKQIEKHDNLRTPQMTDGNIYMEGNPGGQARVVSRTRNGYLQPVHQPFANGHANGTPRPSIASGTPLTPLMIPIPEAGSPNATPMAYYMDSPMGTPTTPNMFKNVAYQIPRHNSIPFEIMDTISEDLRLIIEECRVDSKRLQLKDSIGKGFFGKVYRGHFTDESGKVDTTVAVKTIQGKECTVKDVEAFLAEAIVMKDCHNENVLSLLGVVIAGNRPFAILPYMEHGDLKSYIAEPERSIKVRELLGFGVQVAAGMEYLAGQKIVHRDLATRNCMINKELVVKIADFGLSRDIYKSDYYRVEDKHRPLPVKWMAIESLTGGVFTTSSDVWSFGVILWELLTRGCPPYPDIDTFNLKSYLQSGRRLQQPEHAPDEVYEIMSSCWMERPEDRCNFTQLKDKLSKIVNEEDYMTPEYLKLI